MSNRIYFEIGQDAMQYFRKKERRQKQIEIALYFLFSILVAAVFMYQAITTYSENPTPQYVEAQQNYSLEGGER